MTAATDPIPALEWAGIEPMRQLRLLVTASREWDDPRPINYMLHSAYTKAIDEGFDGLLVVHGGARGGDQLHEDWVVAHRQMGLVVDSEVHKVTAEDWAAIGKSAGHKRNDRMIKLGADLGAAFIRDNSDGAAPTLEKMKRAGIPTLPVMWATRHEFWPMINCQRCEVYRRA